MYTVESEPVELIPIEYEPVFAILRDEDSDVVPSSKIFPDTYPEDMIQLLGDYAQGQPPENSAIAYLIDGLAARKAQIYDEVDSNNGYLTARTYSGLYATSLQVHLARCIDRSFRNLVERPYEPEDAIELVSFVIDMQEARQKAKYVSDIGYMTALRAEYGKSVEPTNPFKRDDIPDIDVESRLGQMLTPELLVAVRQECLDCEIDKVQKDLKRLKFEWMSAVAIVTILKKGEIPMQVARRFNN